VVGEADTGEAAVHLAGELRPDAVLMDVELDPSMDGIEAARLIREHHPATGIVFLSAHQDPRFVASLQQKGAAGWSYLLKQSARNLDAVVRAIEGSVEGLVVLDPALVSTLSPRPQSRLSRLTPRQLETLRLLAEGWSNAAIAERLVITPKSVETYVNAVYRELGLSGEAGVHARVKACLTYLEESQQR
jgi:DNA-binding NarL/FixJ family response regulator